MVDYNALAESIKRSGVKKIAIADRLGVTLNTLLRKLDGRSHWTVVDIENVCDILHIGRDEMIGIFFAD